MTNGTLDNGLNLADIKANAFQFCLKIHGALMECSDTLREDALQLLEQLGNPELDEDDRYASSMLLADILFPHRDPNGCVGLDLAEAEKFSTQQEDPAVNEEAAHELGRMNLEEATFADRLQRLMHEKGITQERLAEQIGVGQPAISMMLQRQCRPQQRTVKRIADALGVSPGDLWPL